MVANPNVNQGAALIVMSEAAARAAGVPEDRMVHLWGGAAAREAEDFLRRDRFDRSTAQDAVLRRAVEIAGGDARAIEFLELYSCFPVVPKMALRSLGLEAGDTAPTVAGGLSFFGGPLNNYMTHALCAMARRLRERPGSRGLAYGQGGYVNKHHALVLSTSRPPAPLAQDYDAQAEAEAGRAAVPPVNTAHRGAATIETYTVLYARDGLPLQGVIVGRTPSGERTMARVLPDDGASMEVLLSHQRSAIGTEGHVRIDTFGLPVWEAGAIPRDRRSRSLRHTKVERDGHLTIVTMDRPNAMNALHPAANAELAEIFDEFAADPEQWVAILTGAGRAFSSGNDLKFMSTALARGESVSSPLCGFAGLTGRFDLNKPVIAAVNGVAMGGGFEIALACDLIIAAEEAVFALPEPKVGLAALEGGLLRLPHQIGLKRAMSLILTGRKVSAREGLELGFVNQVAPGGQLMDEARRWAQEIMACSPVAIRASKEIVRRGEDEPSLASAYAGQQSYDATRALFRSEDLREGPLAFAQKRPPRWKGR